MSMSVHSVCDMRYACHIFHSLLLPGCCAQKFPKQMNQSMREYANKKNHVTEFSFFRYCPMTTAAYVYILRRKCFWLLHVHAFISLLGCCCCLLFIFLLLILHQFYAKALSLNFRQLFKLRCTIKCTLYFIKLLCGIALIISALSKRLYGITASLRIFMMMLLLLSNEKKIRRRRRRKPHESAEITNFLFKFFPIFQCRFYYAKEEEKIDERDEIEINLMTEQATPLE